MSQVILVESCIGGGKTTLVRELGAALGSNALVLLEPDEKEGANPYLKRYYEDPARYAFTMQIHLLALRYRMHLQAQWHAMANRGYALLDRGYQGDTCFARIQHRRGYMSDEEYKTYKTIYQSMTASVLLPNICVRIMTSPTVCLERIKRRQELETGRKCEACIELSYLQELDSEITRMTSILRSQGVQVWEVVYDTDRDTVEQRKRTVESLAERILVHEPVDQLLDLHRRTV